MVRPGLADAIEGVLQSALAPEGYVCAQIEARRNHDGDDALFIVARLEPLGRVPPSRVTTAAMVALSDALLAIGDDRIPYLDHVYPEQPIEDEAA